MKIHELDAAGEIKHFTYPYEGEGSCLVPTQTRLPIEGVLGDILATGASIHEEGEYQPTLYLGRAVQLGRISVGEDASIGNNVRIEDSVVIADGVHIPCGAQIGKEQLIPCSESILTIGGLGKSRQAVTIHGSTSGPRFSLGGQLSISDNTLREWVRFSDNTSPGSVDHYKAYLSLLLSMGDTVQEAYFVRSDWMLLAPPEESKQQVAEVA